MSMKTGEAKLTSRQRQILDFIIERISQIGRFPAVREIGRELGMNSPATVSQHLGALLKKGFLTRQQGRVVVAPQFLKQPGIPIVGRVAAGSPLLAVEHREGTLSLEELFGDSDVFVVRVSGDSMSEAGILDGDHVVVRSQPSLVSGETGVFYLGEDQDVTVKVFRKRRGCVELEPRNDAYESIRVPAGDPHFRIGGKVIGVVRRVR
jgi:repressor LexA